MLVRPPRKCFKIAPTLTDLKTTQALKNNTFIQRQSSLKISFWIHSAAFFLPFLVVLAAGASLPFSAVLCPVAFPALGSLVVFAEAKVSLFPFSAIFLAFGFFAGATLEVPAWSFFGLLGGFESWKMSYTSVAVQGSLRTEVHPTKPFPVLFRAR